MRKDIGCMRATYIAFQGIIYYIYFCFMVMTFRDEHRMQLHLEISPAVVIPQHYCQSSSRKGIPYLRNCP